MKNTIINRQFKYTDRNVTSILVLINVLFFILENAFPSITYYVSLVPLYVRFRHWYWQVFTYMFSHVSFWHLFSNMLGLYIFGRIVEKKVGSREFLLYYLLTGILAGVASVFMYIASGNYVAVILGASGALYAVMLLFSVMFPNAVVLVFGFIPIRAPLLVIIYFFLDFFGQFRADGTAHLVHLFGLLFGILYISIRMRINPFKAWGIVR